jgi:hypothetical protein
MQAGNKEFYLRRFRYLFLLYAFLSSFVSTIDCFLRVSTLTLVDFKQVTESDAFPCDLVPSDCIGFLRVITCGKCIMWGRRTLFGVLYKVRLLMCTDTINTLISGHFLIF